MNGFAVFGVLMLVVILWVCLPRTTMTLLVYTIIGKNYPWIVASDASKNHLGLFTLMMIATVLGVIAGAIIDIKILKKICDDA